MSGGQLVAFFIGVVITIGGVYLLSQRAVPKPPEAAALEGSMREREAGAAAEDTLSMDSGMRTPSALRRSNTALGIVPVMGLSDFPQLSDGQSRHMFFV